MKTNRTYSIDVDVAKDLQQKYNQSQFVEDAIRAKLYPSGHIRHISEYETYELIEKLLKLFPKDSMEYRLLDNMWQTEYKKHTTSSNRDEDL